MNYFKKILALLALAAVSGSVFAEDAIKPSIDITGMPTASAGMLGFGMTGLAAIGYPVKQVYDALGSIAESAKTAFNASAQAMTEGIYANENARAAFGIGVTAMGTWLAYMLASALRGQRPGEAAFLALPGLYGGAAALGTMKGAYEHGVQAQHRNK